MSVFQFKFNTDLEEFAWVSSKIRELLDNGIKPSEIAVISRKHNNLSQILPFLRAEDVPIFYEKGENVLGKIHIQQIIVIIKFLNSLNQKNELEADEFLPQILSFKFWEVDPVDIWKISVEAYSQKQPNARLWLDVIQKYPNPKIQKIANFLLGLGKKSKDESVETILDKILGITGSGEEDEYFDGNEDDIYQTNSDPKLSVTSTKIFNNIFEENLQINSETNALIDFEEQSKYKFNSTFISPYKNFYFPSQIFLTKQKLDPMQQLEQDLLKTEYLGLLSNLRVFVEAVRKYRSVELICVKDVVEFVDLLQKNFLSLIDNSPFNHNQNGVNILTAHKSKGLEFEHVFVISCTENQWMSKGKPSLLSLPKNLPSQRQKDNRDDQLKLFYVALTRAKDVLYLSVHSQNNEGKDVQFLSLVEDNWQEISILDKNSNLFSNSSQNLIQNSNLNFLQNQDYSTKPDLISNLQNSIFKPDKFSLEEKALLESTLQNYQLSVTHLHNFLNVTKGGPKNFFETNFLHFPQTKNSSGKYGSAMHLVLYKLYCNYRQTEILPSQEFLLEEFTKDLGFLRLNQEDYKNFLKRGLDALKNYYPNRKDSINILSQVEVDFKNEGVVIGEAHLTGKIDRIDFEEKSKNLITVTDYKTGKAFETWKLPSKDKHLQLNSWKYEQQLVFYKLLIENSRRFGSKYKVEKGFLEFLESPDKSKKIVILAKEIENKEAENLKNLIQKVYKKIMNLDFPDTSHYSQNLEGIEAFSKDLLEEKI